MSFSDDNPVLFASYPTRGVTVSDLLGGHGVKAKEYIDSLPVEQLLNTSEDTLVAHAASEYLVEPLQIYRDRMEIEKQETNVDVGGDRDRYFSRSGPAMVPGVRLTLSIPFSGDRELWKFTPHSFRSTFPHGNVRGPGADGLGRLEIIFDAASDRAQDRLKGLVDSEIDGINFYIEAQRKDVEAFNESLADNLRASVRNRRDRLEKEDGLIDALGIPLKKRDGAPETRPLPIRRKLARPLPPTPGSSSKPEPGITAECENTDPAGQA